MNAILDECKRRNLGVDLPVSHIENLCGLLFADDLAILAWMTSELSSTLCLNRLLHGAPRSASQNVLCCAYLGERRYRMDQDDLPDAVSNRASSDFALSLGTSGVYVKDSLVRTDLALGCSWLARLRVQNFSTGVLVAKAGLIDKQYLKSCPCCDMIFPENVEHFLLRCSAWKAQRIFLSPGGKN